MICILSSRRDIFSVILSMAVCTRANEFIKYSGKTINPFNIGINEFTNSYIYTKAFKKLINHNLFSRVIEVYYEDIISDPLLLFSLLGINDKLNLGISQKNPYDYKNLVLNIDQLKEKFIELESTELTSNQIKAVSDNIELDLIDIKHNHNGNRKQ